MLYDRPYMRQDPNASDPGKLSMVTTLLVITVGVFVVQQVLNVFFPSFGGGPNFFMAEWFALSSENFTSLKVWTILSYGFLHSTAGFFHILGNMLGLFFIGKILEPILGRERFLVLYLASTLVGGFLYLAVHFNDRSVVVGASASVFGIISLFCLLRPEQPITLFLFFVLPITVKPKWVLRVCFGVSVAGLLFYELPGGSPVAHSAHLGGILSGFLYFRFFHKAAAQPSWMPSGRSQQSVELPKWFKKKKSQPAKRQMDYTVNRTDRDAMQKEVDRILDKINISGFASLTEKEKRTLDDAKDLLSH